MNRLQRWWAVRMVNKGVKLLDKYIAQGRTTQQMYPILRMLDNKLMVGLELGVLEEKDDEHQEMYALRYDMLDEDQFGEYPVRMMN